MKTTFLLKLAICFTLLTTLNSCAVVEGIFKTGMGVGIFLVILVIGVIIFLVTRMGRK